VDAGTAFTVIKRLSEIYKIGADSIIERNCEHNFLYWPSASSKHFKASCFSSTSSSPAKQHMNKTGDDEYMA